MSGYLRLPSIAGDQVAFVCEDDLWLVPAEGGTASRLTAGVAEASHPRLSPDGTRVAFVGADDGPTEVYLLPVSGGSPRRLTFQGARCAVTGWARGGDDILYTSTAEQPKGFGDRLFAVAPSGDPPRLLPFGPASAISHGPHGGLVLGRNTADPARWKRYRGGTAGELWIDQDETGDFRRLLSLPGNVAAPCWVGERIYFIADHEGIGNVYSCRPDGADLSRHSDHTEFYARNLSTDGVRLVYHAGALLYLLDPQLGRPLRIPVHLHSSRSQCNRRFVPAADYLETATLCPDGAKLAITTRGRAFTFAHWQGPVSQLGEPDGVRYRHLTWLAGGTRLIATAADGGPIERLVLVSPDGTAPPVALPTMDIGRVTDLAASPSAQQVAVATHRHELYVVDIDAGGAARRLDRSPYDQIEDLAWSPDGRWLAYTCADTAQTRAIKIADVGAGRTYPVTRPVVRDWSPCFDPAGRYLYFLGARTLEPVRDPVQFSLTFPTTSRPYLVSLRADAPYPFAPFAPGAVEQPVEPMVVDIDGIERRIVPPPVPEARYQQIAAVKDGLLLLSENSLLRFDVETLTTSELATGVDDLTVNGDTVLYRADDRLRVVMAREKPSTTDDDRPGRASGWIDLDRVKVPVRPSAEWRQMFREAWRMQRDHFWDESMSGVDWVAMYERYLPLVELIATRAELSDLLWELQGELCTSHAYERGGEYRPRPEHAQGFLGVDWERDGDKRWRIASILRGDPWNEDATSPCNRIGADIQPGDAVVAVNGQPVGPAGPGELLVGQAGQEVEIAVARGDCEPRRVTVRAIGDEAPARYRDWVERNRAFVRDATQGRIGYIHVPDMYESGYAEFTRSFLAEHDRDGLIVDVRFNGGGFISWLLLERLSRRRYGHESGRWAAALPCPAESPRGPMVAIVNEHTGSDGDIFAHLFKRMRLGPVVGRRTWGGVVATWPRHMLVDGTVTTQPEFCYGFDDVGRRLENHGVEPDIEVDITPRDHLMGVDTQLLHAATLLTRSSPVGGLRGEVSG